MFCAKCAGPCVCVLNCHIKTGVEDEGEPKEGDVECVGEGECDEGEHVLFESCFGSGLCGLDNEHSEFLTTYVHELISPIIQESFFVSKNSEESSDLFLPLFQVDIFETDSLDAFGVLFDLPPVSVCVTIAVRVEVILEIAEVLFKLLDAACDVLGEGELLCSVHEFV